MTITKAIARAWTDAAYKAKLLSDPHAALAAVGVEAPAGTTVKVMEDTAATQHLVLPVSPAAAGELSSEEPGEGRGGCELLGLRGKPSNGGVWVCCEYGRRLPPAPVSPARPLLTAD